MNKSIYYEQSRDLEHDDIGYESNLYEIVIYLRIHVIAIGKHRKVPDKKHKYYLPVYLIYKDRVKSQIGAFEFESAESNSKAQIQPFLDKDGDIDLNRLGDMILYHFVDDMFMKDTQSELSPAEISELEYEYQSQKQNKFVQKPNDEVHPEHLSEEDDVLTLSIPKVKTSVQKNYSDELLKDGVFILDKNRKMPETLLEESKEESLRIRNEFSEKGSKKGTWIERFMKNSQYDIVETETNGNCLFDTLRIAFSQIGYITTIEKLRAILSNEVTVELFETYRMLFLNADSEKQDIEKNMRIISKTTSELKKRIEKITDKSEREKILNNVKDIATQYSELKEKLYVSSSMLSEFEFMRNVDTIEKLREVVKTTTYWADTWAISTLERKLNMKCLIFSEETYSSGDINSVFQCGQLNDVYLQEQGYFSPNFYIMITYSGNHYRLISYKTKYIFKFSEIPYDVKIQVVIKCMEKNAGPYFIIQDFRNFKSRIGMDPDEGFSSEENEEDTRDTFDRDTTFMYYHRSSPTPKAGKGSNEMIPDSKIGDYSQLNTKGNKDWRKKLDDYWMAEFTIDGIKWASVEHYYQSSKFKKSNPDFTKLFSIDSGSEISKDVDLARQAGSKPANKLRPSNIKIDADFYGGRNELERERAIYAKFTQNIDLRNILLATKKAKLTKYIAKSPPETDNILMKVRSHLQKEMPAE
jgi:predicted NAD-dependent protein-ADP-ribosyltransferase YbiA (DUF1768 family)